MDDIHRLIVDQIPHLRRYARALLRNPDAADDLVQECLTRAMDRLHLWKPGSNMRAWLFSILHNQHVNAARRLNRRPDKADPERDHDALRPAPPEQGSRHEVRDLGRALEQLPEEQRQVVLLVGLEGLSYQETAEVLDVPSGTVMSRLNRGRQLLREIMEQNGTPNLRRVK
ncbi:MAG: sigma-70 family RNA polymerase sigma factor [Rhodospirillales bacterium]|nr:sigma-70 family RNA polymerase sigma factor [Rhodospirillales bacterium]